MAEIAINHEDRERLARFQHVLEWLHAEQGRLQAEFAHVARQGQIEQDRLVSFLRQGYGLDPASGFTLDTERGVIVTPDPAPAAEAGEAEGPFLGRED